MLSVVVASRNDGHGVHALDRTQVFLGGLADQVRRFACPVEVIIVEWNPPPDTMPLAEVLRVPRVDGFTVRVITVPQEIHKSLGGPARLPFYQMLAKNVGIRRACGRVVLATNIDILLSDQLFSRITQDIPDGQVFRTDRLDIPFEPASCVDPTVLRTSKPIRRHRRMGVEIPGRGLTDPYVTGGRDVLSHALHRPGRLVDKAFGPHPQNGPPGIPRLRRGFMKAFVLPPFHANACGDFTLMTRESWQHLRGYPEWVLHSWNLDSLLLYQAAMAGYKFCELHELPCLHLEHSGGWTPDTNEALFEKLETDGVDFLPTFALVDVAYAMWRQRRTGGWRTNLRDWGFRGQVLAEWSTEAAGG